MKKKSNVLRMLSALAAAACFLMLSACGGEGETSGEDSSSSASTSVSYELEDVAQLDERPLEGKTVYWLGSSVVYGSASGGVTMAEYMAKRQNCTSVKDAVSGTAFFNGGEYEYLAQRNYATRCVTSTEFDTEADVDFFVCQISTNDAKYPEYLGEATADDVLDRSEFDLTTTMGAVEYIISYVQETWGCPVVFFSGICGYEGEERHENYGVLVDCIRALEDKWGIYVLDLFNDEEFNDLTDEERALYVADYGTDNIHPTKAGYLEWWTPAFESYLTEVLGA